jgi:Holliday junction resolvase RusA-like endonuclease
MIEEARQNLRGKTVEIRVHFRLWKGSERTSNTRCKKDLDNLLKPVLDVLQDSLNAQKGEGGLGLIEDDDAVYNLSASKGLVESEQDEGVRIVILEHGLVPGTNRSSAGNHERMLDHSVGD